MFYFIQNLLCRAEEKPLREPERLRRVLELVRVRVSLEEFLHSMKDYVGSIWMGLDYGLKVECGEGDVTHGVVGLQGVSDVSVSLKV